MALALTSAYDPLRSLMPEALTIATAFDSYPLKCNQLDINLRPQNRNAIKGSMMRKLLGLIALGLSLIASPLAAQTTASTGRGVRLNQTVTEPLGLARADVAFETETTAAAFPSGPPEFSQIRRGFDQSIDLSAFGAGLSERLTTGFINISAMASATQATGTATVNNLNFSLGTNLSSLLTITSTTVQSTSTATVSPLDASGTTTIQNLQLTGSLFTGGTLTLSAELQAQLAAGTVAPNTVIFDSAGVKIILNRQVETPTTNADGSSTLAIATDAIAVQFTNAPVGTGVKNGELLIASSSASATTAAVPISP